MDEVTKIGFMCLFTGVMLGAVIFRFLRQAFYKAVERRARLLAQDVLRDYRAEQRVKDRMAELGMEIE